MREQKMARVVTEYASGARSTIRWVGSPAELADVIGRALTGNVRTIIVTREQPPIQAPAIPHSVNQLLELAAIHRWSVNFDSDLQTNAITMTDLDGMDYLFVDPNFHKAVDEAYAFLDARPIPTARDAE